MTDDAALATEWFDRFEGAGLDGVVAKRLDGVYLPNKREMVKVKHPFEQGIRARRGIDY